MSSERIIFGVDARKKIYQGIYTFPKGFKGTLKPLENNITFREIKAVDVVLASMRKK